VTSVDENAVEQEALAFLRKRGKLPAAAEELEESPDEAEVFQQIYDSIEVPASVEEKGFDAVVAFRSMKAAQMMAEQQVAPMRAVFQEAGAQAQAQVLGQSFAAEFGRPEAAPEVEQALVTAFGEKLPGILQVYQAGTSPVVTAMVRNAAELAVVKSKAQRVTAKPGDPQPADREPVGGGGVMPVAPMTDEEKGLNEAIASEIARRGTAEDAVAFQKKTGARR